MATKPIEAAITSDEMQVAELNSEYLGVSLFQLMEAVGANVSREIATRTATKPNPRIHIISGPGKNGGDGFAVARHLASQGLKVRVTLVGRPNDVKDEAAKQQLNTIIQMNDSIQFESLSDSSQLRPVEADIILDAILGYGVQGDLRQPILGAVRIINRSRGYKIALDLPSGLDSDTGEPHGEAVKADLTISLHKVKQGLVKGKEYAGETISLSIGIPPEAEIYAGPGDFKTLWKPRPANAHKGDYGRLLIIGGSENFTGAPAFSALAATKCGTDLVYVASPTKTSEIIASYSPDLITVKLPGEHLNLKDLPELEKWMTSSDDIIADPTRLKLNKTGNPYMTVGGTGDVLTGIIGALLAQHIEPFRAAAAGAFLNGLAGDMLMKERGPTVTPLALVDFIPQAIKYCIDGPPYPKIRN